jgi:hypothetical protein
MSRAGASALGADIAVDAPAAGGGPDATLGIGKPPEWGGEEALPEPSIAAPKPDELSGIEEEKVEPDGGSPPLLPPAKTWEAGSPEGCAIGPAAVSTAGGFAATGTLALIGATVVPTFGAGFASGTGSCGA